MMKERMKKSMRQLGGRIDQYRERNWKNTQLPVYRIFKLLCALVAGIEGTELFRHRIAAFCVSAAVGYIAGCLALHAIQLLVRLTAWLVREERSKELICWILTAALCAELFEEGSVGVSASECMAAGIVSAVALLLFGKSVRAFFKNKIHTPTIIITGVVAGIFTVGCTAFLIGTGFEDSYIERYLALYEKTTVEKDGFAAELSDGGYTAETIEYSPDKDTELSSTIVDLSYAAKNAAGIEGFLRDVTTEYDISQAPVAGVVYYPKEGKNCPVLVFAHGNHSNLTDSYLGYAYLGKYLASHGYVVVSVDENVCNELTDENDARAILLLENVKKVLEYNKEEGNPLYGKINEDQIAIGGHSRGGEMAATAYLFSGYSCYPENGKYKFDYDFDIRSVVAVAPSVNQYMPSGHEVILENVNYLLLQGANDQDVSRFLGNEQYENTVFTEDNDYLKTSLYIAGANHGQFNSLWGGSDLSAVEMRFLNTRNFITQQEQQTILKLFVKVFLDKTLKGETRYEDLLTDYKQYLAYLPHTLYIQQYERSGSQMLCDYEEDSELSTGTAEGVTLAASHMHIWTEEQPYYSAGSSKRKTNYALKLVWWDTKMAFYAIRMQKPFDGTGAAIVLDICDLQDNRAEDSSYQGIKPKITLMDTQGNTAEADVSAYARIYPPLPIKLSKLQYLLGISDYRHEFQTAAIPVGEFQAENEDFDIAHIRKIEISFPEDADGRVLIDNIGIQR